MIANQSFEVVEVAGEYLAIPVGDLTAKEHTIFALSEPVAYLLRNMSCDRTYESLLDLLIAEYDEDRNVLSKDLEQIIPKLVDIGLIKE